jgi:molybdopterin-biosynthesis enzyme MoeA-like protein
MAAKGEQVNLSELAQTEQVSEEMKHSTKNQEASPVNGTSKATIKQPQTIAGAQPASNPMIDAPSTSPAQATYATTTGAPVVGTAMPQALLNTGNIGSKLSALMVCQLTTPPVQDEGMKNLMMSWYYAGYYTGLLEGQQKAFASMREAERRHSSSLKRKGS